MLGFGDHSNTEYSFNKYFTIDICLSFDFFLSLLIKFAKANLRTSSSGVFVLVEGLRKSTALSRCFWLAPVGQRIFIRRVCLAGKLANFLFESFRPYRGIKKKAPHYYGAFFLMAPPVGLEPTTLRLTAACSTD